MNETSVKPRDLTHLASSHVPNIIPTTWVLPNRVEFPQWMKETFKYDSNIMDPKGLYMHQGFVRDFLQPSSPYRGLLLYHGLGVGKTCAAIAIADVLRPPALPNASQQSKNQSQHRKKVFVMLPAFLKDNFIEQVKKCGDARFSTNKSWRVRESLPTKKSSHKMFDGVPVSEGGIAFEHLDPHDRDLVIEQINQDIMGAYTLIHYNGLSSTSVEKLCGGSTNMFDDSVVVIDEAPNVIGQVMHLKLMARVYQRIMDADRCKIVLLSGTPLVNHPLELAFISNLTHGYIREVTFHELPSGVDVAAVEHALSQVPHVDHVTTEVLVNGSRVTASLLPGGFIRADDQLKSHHVIPEANITTPRDVIALLKRTASLAANINLQEPVANNRFLLPIDRLKFDAAFVNEIIDGEPPSVKNAEVLARRILGTVSVYSSTDPALMPSIALAQVIRLPMSDRQYSEYLVQRDVERRKEKIAARFAARAAASGNETESTNLYRAFSRSVCTFVFPEGIKRPYRSKLFKNVGTEGEDNEGDDDTGYETPFDKKTAKLNVDREYEAAIQSALSRIYEDRIRLLSLSGELPILSPKYTALISHLLEPGSARKPAIIYSQFRSVEGLGLLGMALQANGFAELRVSMKAGTLVTQVFPEDAPADAPRFIVYGNDDSESAKTMLKIFNSELSSLSSSAAKSLREVLKDQPGLFDGAEGNKHGAIARLLLITQSGSEGISTRNVREVHVIEPFWHANRILQVVGRAARSNSHEDLPVSERNVDVFVYAATFTKEQSANVTITKLDQKRTSDEHILSVAAKKRAILDRFTDVLRRAAVDCAMHHDLTSDKRCFSHVPSTLSKGLSALAFHTNLDVDIATQGRRIRLVPFEMDDGTIALADPMSGAVYDKDLYTSTGQFRRITIRRPSSIVSPSRSLSLPSNLGTHTKMKQNVVTEKE